MRKMHLIKVFFSAESTGSVTKEQVREMPFILPVNADGT